MSEDEKISKALEAVEGIVKAVPVYQDAIQPGAKQVGTALETVGKAVNVALAPVSAMIWGYEKIREFVIPALAKRLQHAAARLVPPSPTVAGPVLESLRFCGHESTLREMYANLLATAMDSATVREAHPAFAEIIRQLTPDEARIVGMFPSGRPFPVLSIRAELQNGLGGIDVHRHISLLGVEAGCVSPYLTPTYLSNICRLGLAEIPPMVSYTTPGVYDALEKHPEVLKAMESIKESGGRQPRIVRQSLMVTTFGHQFCLACVVRRESLDEPKPQA